MHTKDDGMVKPSCSQKV